MPKMKTVTQPFEWEEKYEECDIYISLMKFMK